MPKRVLDVLIESGALTAPEASAVRKEAAQKKISIEEALLNRGFDEDLVVRARSEVLGIPVFSLKNKKVPFDALKFISEESARHYQFVPLGQEGTTVLVGMVDPDSIVAKEALNFITARTNRPLKVFLISRKDFSSVLDEYRGISGEANKVLDELESAFTQEEFLASRKAVEQESVFVEDAPITKMVAVILRHATEGRASDIHIEPTHNQLRVRFRVDGILYTSLLLPINVHDAIVSKVKILTNMQLDEKRRPQDGRFSTHIEDREIDFRVSTLPTYFGEKVAIRILDPRTGIHTLDDLGLEGRNLELIRDGLKRPYGLILITGPTGSGKSTTLYAMLSLLNQERWNVISLEDPVEYSVEGVNQSQVRPEIGYDFAEGLRNILRQDPDVIMVGEIRDKETAHLAIHAALTGHLVLSTLHTNNATGVIPRLIDMGVEPYLIAPTLALAVGQRLVRTLCPESREEIPVEGTLRQKLLEEIRAMPAGTRKDLELPPVMYSAKPSSVCPKGTRGRMALFEVLMMTRELERIIVSDFSKEKIEEEAQRQGMLTMHHDGILKVLEGKVGLEELSEVT
ncbi:MAG TPA: GspE/PulE family protein [Candidatus Paceibacterota bacterium]